MAALAVLKQKLGALEEEEAAAAAASADESGFSAAVTAGGDVGAGRVAAPSAWRIDYSTAYQLRPGSDDVFFAPTDDDYPFEATGGYGVITRAPPLPTPAPNSAALLFHAPARLEEEVAAYKTLLERPESGTPTTPKAAGRLTAARCSALRNEVAALRAEASGIFGKCGVDTSSMERLFAVAHPPCADTADCLMPEELPALWKREEDDRGVYRDRVVALRNFAHLQRLRRRLAAQKAEAAALCQLRRMKEHLTHDVAEGYALVEAIDNARASAGVAFAAAARSHDEEAAVQRLAELAVAEEQRMQHQIPHMHRGGDRAIAQSFPIVSLQRHKIRGLECDAAVEKLRTRLREVETATFPDVATAHHVWSAVAALAAEVRGAVRDCDTGRAGRRARAEQRYAAVRDATAQALISAIPLSS